MKTLNGICYTLATITGTPPTSNRTTMKRCAMMNKGDDGTTT